MDGERYFGERRALRQFLRELRPLVAQTLGRDALLGHRIDRALHSGDLPALRAAREMFHNQPEDLKRRLMRGIRSVTAACRSAKLSQQWMRSVKTIFGSHEKRLPPRSSRRRWSSWRPESG